MCGVLRVFLSLFRLILFGIKIIRFASTMQENRYVRHSGRASKLRNYGTKEGMTTSRSGGIASVIRMVVCSREGKEGDGKRQRVECIALVCVSHSMLRRRHSTRTHQH